MNDRVKPLLEFYVPRPLIIEENIYYVRVITTQTLLPPVFKTSLLTKRFIKAFLI